MTVSVLPIKSAGIKKVASFALLPTSASDGDLYETLDTHEIWIWNASDSVWIPVKGTVTITVSNVDPTTPGQEGDLWVVV